MAIDWARRGGCGMTVIVLFARNSRIQITQSEQELVMVEKPTA
jgi:hypothetical protein